MVASLPQVVHEEPEHVTVEQVSVVQAVFIPLPLVLLYHLEPNRVVGLRVGNEQEPWTQSEKTGILSQ